LLKTNLLPPWSSFEHTTGGHKLAVCDHWFTC